MRITLLVSSILLLWTHPSLGQVNQGVATYFDGIATPYGGCGVPESVLETEDYVALNVYNSPGVGTMWTRPLTGGNLQFVGEYNNGNNCGRWMTVTIGENCINSSNDGALGQPFCNGGQWVNDQFSGATLPMLVTDACGDNNGWCRDSRYHLDIHKVSLNKFIKNGQPLTNLYPFNWNNRKIYWEYIKAPNYSGDINIYFLQNAQYYWPCITINHLENGIHEIEQKVNGLWVTLSRNSDMGQSFILQQATEYRIRIKDADNQYINNYREYVFTLPPSCSPTCTPVVTPVTYSTYNPISLHLSDSPTTGVKQDAQGIEFWWPEEWGLDPTFQLFDLNGTKVHTLVQLEKKANGTVLHLSNLAPGIYLYNVTTIQKNYSGKFMNIEY